MTKNAVHRPNYGRRNQVRNIFTMNTWDESNSCANTARPAALTLADRLELCEPKHRCLSGACPECGRLLQRWFVRRSRKFIAKHISRPEHDLVAVSIVPSSPAAGLGQLLTVDIVNLQRRLKYTLKKADRCRLGCN